MTVGWGGKERFHSLFTQALNPHRLGRRCRPGKQTCHHPDPASASLYPGFLSIPHLFAAGTSLHSHIPKIKIAGTERQEEEKEAEGGDGGSCGPGQWRCVWVMPTSEALIGVSPWLMCSRQNPFVSHLFP